MKVAIYANNSLTMNCDEQLKLCKEYINSYYNENYIDKVFIYEEKSTPTNNNFVFSKLMADAASKNFDILICYNLKSLFKNLKNFQNTYTLLNHYGIDLISVSEKLNTNTNPYEKPLISLILNAFLNLEC
ncbi:recombinase family protein [Clostridium saccharobutylicum]|uniref:recombinase family protein n=1 Tax=Clostridium saccharobutylicum TaxID=169679 RepID=UPI0005A0CA1C|nr:recombinase family protein [Clostridium saccharobutylicum]AQR90030.1 hypothetical protein CLOSC_17370 [Clostridium saccharobutylicum]AQR99935.1 hypothetical protein CSACC_17440 [Clostridium saccharobutylicum]AQS09719.1 hypothetical protein CLOBY_18500 [Clostridium saccharobutylicum]AQS13919.1 hypothetical protein CLOSACC_17440 [Clostridium saccharobutylicum]MBA2904674.1 DNA invertase Pin-like site-specific DNA recombinase [Clostridium saccharobutylicum]